jgi:hypothetical protein
MELMLPQDSLTTLDAERWRSPAAGSRSEARAEAGGSQVQRFDTY